MSQPRKVPSHRVAPLAFLIALLTWPLPGLGISQDPGSAPSTQPTSPNRQVPGRTAAPPRSRMLAPSYSISGAVRYASAGCTPTGRRVVVRLRRDGRAVGTRELVLDEAGGASFRFDLGSTVTAIGSYTLLVEQGSPNPTAYTCTANLCLDSVDPANRFVTLSAASRNATDQDFSLSASVAFNRAGWCW